METFFNDLNGKIQEAIKSVMPKIFEEIGNEKLYSAALVTDSDCITLFLAINTIEYLEKADKEYFTVLNMGDSLSEEDIKSLEESTASLTKWLPDEWGYSDDCNDQFNEISQLLWEESYTISNAEYEDYEKEDAAYEEYKNLFFETVISAFKHTIDEKVFGKYTDEITFFVSISDDENAEKIENNSAKILNSNNIYMKYFLIATYYD